MTTDADLCRIINSCLPAANAAFAQAHLAFTADRRSIWDVARPLHEAMDSHPEFSEASTRFYFGKQLLFLNHHQAVNLLRVATMRGADGALFWYRNVRATRRTGIRVVAEVHGLFVREAHQFSNGVTITPVEALSDSPNSALLKQPISSGMRMEFPAAVTIEVGEVDGEEDHQSGYARFLEIADKARRTIEAFVLADGAAPTTGAFWQEFTDPEFQHAEFGRAWMGSQHEGRLPDHPVHVTSEMTEWVERYLALPEVAMKVYRVPIQRLNLARRRYAPGDKAIDGSICLEALLSGKARGELTHRLSVRTALLLAQTLQDRIAIATRVRKFYSLRSQVVHGASPKEQAGNHQIAEDGLALCASALRAMVLSGEVPNPEEWELSGGPPWNRFSPLTPSTDIQRPAQS